MLQQKWKQQEYNTIQYILSVRIAGSSDYQASAVYNF
jgi:hypothetical protein